MEKEENSKLMQNNLRTLAMSQSVEYGKLAIRISWISFKMQIPHFRSAESEPLIKVGHKSHLKKVSQVFETYSLEREIYNHVSFNQSEEREIFYLK